MGEDIRIVLEWIKTLSTDMNAGFDRVIRECKEAIKIHASTCEMKQLIQNHLKDHEKLEKKKIHDLN